MLTRNKATVADYRKLPEGARYELIDGEIIEREKPSMPGPKIKHQALSTRLIIALGKEITGPEQGLLLHAPTDVYFNEENAFQPDILFVAGEKSEIVKEDGIYGAPDLIVEVLSPSTGYYDLKKKFQVYEKYGVREYFIIDPEDNEAVGYRNDNGKYHEFTRNTGRFRSELLNREIVFA